MSCLNENFNLNNLISLLSEKNIDPIYLSSLNNRKVKVLQRDLYSKLGDGGEGERSLSDIPVSKIISTHRTGANDLTWFDNVFDFTIRNTNINKFNNILLFLQNQTLKEFQKSLYSVAPPLNNVAYFQDLDSYVIEGDGHHRTIWAVFTNTPFLKALNVTSYVLDPIKVKKDAILDEKLHQTEKAIVSYKNLINELLKDFNFNLDDNVISFREMTISVFPSTEFRNFIVSKQNLLEVNFDYLHSLKIQYQSLTELINTHNRYKFIPLRFRKLVVLLFSNLSDNRIYEKLHKLYSVGWNGRKRAGQ